MSEENKINWMYVPFGSTSENKDKENDIKVVSEEELLEFLECEQRELNFVNLSPWEVVERIKEKIEE